MAREGSVTIQLVTMPVLHAASKSNHLERVGQNFGTTVTGDRLRAPFMEESGADAIVNAVTQHLANTLTGAVLKPFPPEPFAAANRTELFQRDFSQNGNAAEFVAIRIRRIGVKLTVRDGTISGAPRRIESPPVITSTGAGKVIDRMANDLFDPEFGIRDLSPELKIR